MPVLGESAARLLVAYDFEKIVFTGEDDKNGQKICGLNASRAFFKLLNRDFAEVRSCAKGAGGGPLVCDRWGMRYPGAGAARDGDGWGSRLRFFVRKR
jgi:hypothetical protein